MEDDTPPGTYSHIRFGSPAEWGAFGERHQHFIDRFGRLRDVLNSTFLRQLEKTKTIDVLLFGIGRQSVDDFFEVLVMCGNAEGYGAQKLLRTMFERVVLLKYLHRHPESIDLYLSYYHVVRRKEMLAAERYEGKGTVPAERLREAERRFEEVKERYRTRECPKCERREMGPSWTSVPLPDMAVEVGLGKFVFEAYYKPLRQAHPNIDSLLRRLEGDSVSKLVRNVPVLHSIEMSPGE